jgi:predicted MPP superfamily phosphohydrolase
MEMSWWIGLALFLLTAGFAKLSTVALNRLLAHPYPKWVMAIAEIIQLSIMPLYAWLLFCEFGGGRFQRRFETLSWGAIDPLTMILVSVGVFGFGLLVSSTMIYQTYRPPSCQLAEESQVIDFRKTDGDQSWRTTLVGPRPMRRIALLPGNEQFTLEVSTKTFSLPRLPLQWDGLSIVQLADSHFRGAVTRKYFEAVCEQAMALKPDLFVFTGDLLDDLSLLDWFPETLGRLKAPLGQYFILGNHDWYIDAFAIREEFVRHGWIDLSSRSLELKPARSGPAIVLAGDETPWMGSHPNFFPEQKHSFRILLSHTPDNVDWAREQGVDLVLAGHTHGGQIRLPILGPVYSPSRFDCRFASGVFWLDPTLLYVSRGLSGREPVRYLCVPELNKLVLKSNIPHDQDELLTT